MNKNGLYLSGGYFLQRQFLSATKFDVVAMRVLLRLWLDFGLALQYQRIGAYSICEL